MSEVLNLGTMLWVVVFPLCHRSLLAAVAAGGD